ncbi:MAG: hypothetical protein LBC82_04680 [Oscillospiraceae bacterium]|jgi:hypothetical protein|nr:hypothetical protein [Oscillospiraceae bacterium]
MRKKSFLRLLFETLGSAVIGNVMALVVTISLASFGTGNALLGISAFCSISVYLMLVFNSGYKDGEIDRKLIQRKVIEKPEGGKWVKIGCLIGGFFCVASALLLLFTGSGGETGTAISADGGYLNPFRLALGAIMAVSLLLGGTEIPIWSPLVFMGIFALTPVACRFGYWVGVYEKWTIDNIVYKKKK